jgi:hypothetical protein
MRDVLNNNAVHAYFIVCVIILVMAILFLLPALYNGFPFVLPDTHSYLGGGGLTHIPESRPIYYAWFTRLFDLPILVHSSISQTPWHLKGWSPWPSIIFQSLIAAWVIWLFASALFAITAAPRLLLLALTLALGTSLPWIVGQIMPDIFTPLMILALALLCLTPDTLPTGSRIVLTLLVGATVSFHQANLLVALWMLPALVLCVLLGWRPSRPIRHGLLASGMGLTLGAAALLVANLAEGRVGLSNGGSVFLLARLMDDGTALSYLEKTCPQRRFSICADLDELRSFRPTMITIPGCGSVQTTLNSYFLWEGPLDRLGGFRVEQAEASAIVLGTLAAYPLAQLRAAVDNGLLELFSFRAGEDMCAYPETSLGSITIRNVFGQVVYDRYLGSKQMRDALFDRLGWANHIQACVLVASSLVLIGFLVVGGLRKQPRAFFVTICVIVLVIGNALTLGIFSGPSDRYQSRVIWLVPLLAACIMLQRLPGPAFRKRDTSAP